ncbi:hypothetical protein DERP_011457 [Dermatophagoides pteronyssinus]|uniref:Uncharacterized protein n=1 Tax=Dermatophagoides pteronyssinus TaxID=6956 RepID=A0ABQ8J5I5_DERPT|nr:hypothetical protein DERP_011457 [Dermatophagoides pteronyssinus]
MCFDKQQQQQQINNDTMVTSFCYIEQKKERSFFIAKSSSQLPLLYHHHHHQTCSVSYRELLLRVIKTKNVCYFGLGHHHHHVITVHNQRTNIYGNTHELQSLFSIGKTRRIEEFYSDACLY